MSPIISWKDYAVIVAILIAVYYAAIYFIFFRKGNWKAKSGRQESAAAEKSFSPTQTLLPKAAKEANSNSDQNDLSAVIHDFVDEFKHLPTNEPFALDEKNMLLSLKALIEKYPRLRKSSYKEALSQLMINECADKLDMHLEEKDVSRLWD